MSQLTINRQGPEAMRDNPRRGDILDYVDRSREYQPPIPDWRVILARAAGIGVLFLIFLVVAGIWWLGACTFAYNSICADVADWTPRILFGVPLLALLVYVVMWWRREQAGVNRASLVLSRWGNLQPTDLYCGLPKDQQILLFTLLERQSSQLKLATAPYEQTPGLNSLSLAGRRRDDDDGDRWDDEPDNGPPPVGPTPMPRDEWMRRLLFSPDVYPHKASVGPTGSRKTTFMRACLVQLGLEWDFVVLTFKPGDWPDVPTITPDMHGDELDCTPMAMATVNVFKEMMRRNREGWRGQKRILLVSDDHSQLVAERKEMQLLIARILGIGRSAGIHIWLTDTERNVKAWGLEGRGEARDNLLVTQHTPETFDVRLGKIAANGQWRRDESWPDGPILLDTSGFIRPVDLSHRGQPSQSPGERAVVQGLSASVGVSDRGGSSVTSGRQPLNKDEQIALWMLKYGTRERARSAGCQFDNDDWARVRARLID